MFTSARRLALLLVPLLAACDALAGETDVSGLIASQLVSVALSPEGVAGGLLVSEKAVNPDTFLAQIRGQMASIESVSITRVQVEALGNGAVDVAAWSDVYQGELLVVLVPTSGNPIQVAQVSVPTSGLATLTATVTTSREALDAVPDIAAGRFTVRLTGGTGRAATDTFALTARVSLEFIAF